MSNDFLEGFTENLFIETPQSEVLIEQGDQLVLLEVAEQGPPGPPGGGGIAQVRFVATATQADFVLTGRPINGICLFSLNGVLQHEYACLGSTVSIDPPAEAGDHIMITWWQYA